MEDISLRTEKMPPWVWGQCYLGRDPFSCLFLVLVPKNPSQDLNQTQCNGQDHLEAIQVARALDPEFFLAPSEVGPTSDAE